MTLTPGRYCACGCNTSLHFHRADAKWATGACEKAWKRRNPGRSPRNVQAIVVGPTKARRKSGVSVRIAARGAIAAIAPELRQLGHPDPDRRARELITPLAAPRHRRLLDES